MRRTTATRGTRLLAAAACALLAALGVASPAEAADGFAYGPEQLELVSRERVGDRQLELHFRTPAVEGDAPVRVLLPDGYDADDGRRYPVLYLLRGCCDDNAGYRWTDVFPLERYTAGVPVIVVMPESGPAGGYVDWYNNGAGGPPMWETYHLGQLLPWIDGHFRTIPSRQARAVAGLSMGGYGAMEYAARHPDLFVAATSWSGAVDTNSFFLRVSGAFSPTTDNAGTRENGLRETEEVRWRGHNPWDLAENLAGLALTLRTGNGEPGGPGGESYYDPVEAEVHEESVSLHERLVELAIPHVWDDYGPGCHCVYYWDRGLKQLIPDLERVFADPPPPPSPVTYRSIDPAYEAYGWKVTIDRPALEFSELDDANRNGFALRGSGTGAVTTPPRSARARQPLPAVHGAGAGVRAPEQPHDDARHHTIGRHLGHRGLHDPRAHRRRTDAGLPCR